MKRHGILIIAMALFVGPAMALKKSEVKAIVETAYPGAKITEIEKERYKGQKVYEVDFKHDGQNLEAIISLDGEIIKVDIDD